MPIGRAPAKFNFIHLLLWGNAAVDDNALEMLLLLLIAIAFCLLVAIVLWHALSRQIQMCIQKSYIHTYFYIYMLYVCDVCNAVNRQVIDSIVMLVFKMYLDEIAQFHRILNNIWLRLYRYLIGCVLGNVLAGILEMRSGIIGMWWWKA